MKRAGAHGIVSGVLEPGVDQLEATKVLVDAADPLPFTFHRAFDLAPELEFALDELREIGVRRVLTSGGASMLSSALMRSRDCNETPGMQ
jgi:copper homeostasis protein